MLWALLQAVPRQLQTLPIRLWARKKFRKLPYSLEAPLCVNHPSPANRKHPLLWAIFRASLPRLIKMRRLVDQRPTRIPSEELSKSNTRLQGRILSVENQPRHLPVLQDRVPQLTAMVRSRCLRPSLRLAGPQLGKSHNSVILLVHRAAKARVSVRLVRKGHRPRTWVLLHAPRLDMILLDPCLKLHLPTPMLALMPATQLRAPIPVAP